MVKRNLFFAMVFQKKGVFSIVLNVVVLNQPHPDDYSDEPLHVVQCYICPFVKSRLRFQVLCLRGIKKILCVFISFLYKNIVNKLIGNVEFKEINDFCILWDLYVDFFLASKS